MSSVREGKPQHIEEYVAADGTNENALEGFWGMLKRGIYGTHISVSAKQLWVSASAVRSAVDQDRRNRKTA